MQSSLNSANSKSAQTELKFIGRGLWTERNMDGGEPNVIILLCLSIYYATYVFPFSFSRKKNISVFPAASKLSLSSSSTAHCEQHRGEPPELIFSFIFIFLHNIYEDDDFFLEQYNVCLSVGPLELSDLGWLMQQLRFRCVTTEYFHFSPSRANRLTEMNRQKYKAWGMASGSHAICYVAQLSTQLSILRIPKWIPFLPFSCHFNFSL